MMLLVSLLGLALLDSTTVGTLLIPLWLLIAAVAPRRILGYLGAVAGAYFLIGLALQLGFGAVLEAYRDALTSALSYQVQLVLGVLLVLTALVLWLRARRRTGQPAAPEQPGWLGTRIVRVRARIAEGSTTTMLSLALAAVALEVATMFPYLGAIGLMTQHGPGFPATVLLLAGYCVVMVLPAAALVGARARWGTEFDEPLRWIEEQAGSSTARSASRWLLAAFGVVLAVNSAYTLWG
ncbi:GAP family protein [Citricoccus muralis]|uniref:GAP family protein n=1 Tax=Citricoccus muralis TaxID=169134 RepID=A0ABY8H5D7_9MICC|nr:GAP family protein [Citricoccus muralis]WFP16357.1 GAP family protein [Citricoccus muralis]